MDIRVRMATAADIAAVHALYAAGGYGGGVHAGDMVIVATVGSDVVGVVRLCTEHGVTVLRGMQVASAHRGCGLGRALLEACAAALGGQPAYCLPYAHLVGFYGSIGFAKVQDDALPGFLRQRRDAYRTAGEDVVGMKREAKSGS
jgi:predicted N-acetyltransferase YhbS